MMMKFAPAIGAFVLALTPALAQAPDGERGGRMAACRADIAAHCSSTEAGGGRRIACLMQNKAKLSAECAAVVEARGEKTGGRREEVGQGAGAAPDAKASAPAQAGDAASGKRGRGRMAACKTDVATFCGNAEKGKARGQCLRENQAKLSPECQTAISERQVQGKSVRTACKADRESLCANVERGGGRAMQCLRDNRDKLSPACGEALSAMPERGRGKGKRA